MRSFRDHAHRRRGPGVASEAGVVAWAVRRARITELPRGPVGGEGRASIPGKKMEEIVRLTLQETPAGATHWSCRTMGAIRRGSSTASRDLIDAIESYLAADNDDPPSFSWAVTKASRRSAAAELRGIPSHLQLQRM